jgi:phosphoglycerol transferase MdoB-like AlkP superfamily enzyme
MNLRSEVRRRFTVLAVLAPLPVVAAAVIWTWSWWVTLIALLVVVAVVAEFAGIYAGAIGALLATAGIALVVDRARDVDHPRNGIELGAMAALLIVAALFGTDRPSDD